MTQKHSSGNSLGNTMGTLKARPLWRHWSISTAASISEPWRWNFPTHLAQLWRPLLCSPWTSSPQTLQNFLVQNLVSDHKGSASTTGVRKCVPQNESFLATSFCRCATLRKCSPWSWLDTSIPQEILCNRHPVPKSQNHHRSVIRWQWNRDFILQQASEIVAKLAFSSVKSKCRNRSRSDFKLLAVEFEITSDLGI